MLTMLESPNYSFRNPKNIIWITYRIKELRNYKKKNHGILRGPQLDKQRWRARLGILRVNHAHAISILRQRVKTLSVERLRNSRKLLVAYWQIFSQPHTAIHRIWPLCTLRKGQNLLKILTATQPLRIRVQRGEEKGENNLNDMSLT